MKEATKSTWVGGKFFERVCREFQEQGYQPPKPDTDGGSGAYAMNIVRQYSADLTEGQVLGIIRSVQFVRE